MEYVIEKNDKGQSVPKKVGMAPIQREGMEYEFDIVGDLDAENTLIITKSRCRILSGEVIKKPGDETALIIKDWLTDGVDLEAIKIQQIKDKWESLAGNLEGFDEFFNKQQEKGIGLQQIEEFLSERIKKNEQRQEA